MNIHQKFSRYSSLPVNGSLIILIGLMIGIFTTNSCKKKDDALTDAQQLAALKNVTIDFDSMSYTISLPDGALSGASFDSLLALDSAKYANPANYAIDIAVNNTADNTKAQANDAKFDGMVLDIVMDTIESGPISTVAPGFYVPKGTTKAVKAAGAINLATHKRTGLYIFRQTVDGLDLAATLKPTLKYEIGGINGNLPLPAFQQNIPTRASDEMKAFLQGLLESAIFEE